MAQPVTAETLRHPSPFRPWQSQRRRQRNEVRAQPRRRLRGPSRWRLFRLLPRAEQMAAVAPFRGAVRFAKSLNCKDGRVAEWFKAPQLFAGKGASIQAAWDRGRSRIKRRRPIPPPHRRVKVRPATWAARSLNVVVGEETAALGDALHRAYPLDAGVGLASGHILRRHLPAPERRQVRLGASPDK